MRKVNILENQKGFTLIEIIAVLVILGILAAVAVPKFMSLTNEAKQKSVEGALSSGLSTVSMQYARLSLSYDKEPTMAQLAAAASSEPGGGDFSFNFKGISLTSEVLIRAWNPTETEFSTSKRWKKPK